MVWKNQALQFGRKLTLAPGSGSKITGPINVNPEKRVVLETSFYWDAELHVEKGPAAIFSNCDELHVFLDNEQTAVLQPDRKNYPRLTYPLIFVDLSRNVVKTSTLRIDGFIKGKLRISRSFDGNHTKDKLQIEADTAEITADGIDSTRIWFTYKINSAIRDLRLTAMSM